LAMAYSLTVVSSEANQLINRRIVLYRFGDRREAQAVAAALSADTRVAGAQPNWRYRVMQSATSSNGSRVGTSSLQYALAKLGLSDAHAIVQGRGVKIAVIDSGVDEAHPALTNAISTTLDAAPQRGQPIGKHGTAIAGIFKAQGMLKGVAPSSELMAIRAFFSSTNDGPEQSSTAIILRSLDWAIRKNARVINMSFAGPADEALGQAVRAARRQGAVLIAAAGNGGLQATPAYPAAYPDVIAVTATDARDRLYHKANRGEYIDVAAPGVDIFVVAPGQGYRHDSGTSLAAAHVSGIVALLLERDGKLNSTAITELLRDGADDLGKPGPDAAFGAGSIHAVKLLKSTTVDVAKQ